MTLPKTLIAFILSVVLAAGWGFAKGRDYEKMTHVWASQEATAKQKETRDETQSRIETIATEHAKASQGSTDDARRIADDLRSRNVRLSVQLADAKGAAVEAYNRGLSDGRAELHPETAEALIGITRDADRQVKALQDTLKEVTNVR